MFYRRGVDRAGSVLSSRLMSGMGSTSKVSSSVSLAGGFHSALSKSSVDVILSPAVHPPAQQCSASIIQSCTSDICFLGCDPTSGELT